MNAPSVAVLRSMLDLQVGMNRKIDPQWHVAGFAFLRAVFVESAEALEHYGWKWWKKQTSDMGQLRIELIDIWHFVMSHYLVLAASDQEAAAQAIACDWVAPPEFEFDSRIYQPERMEMREQLELLAALSAVRRVHLPLVVALFKGCGLDAQGLYTAYVSKNVLNHFRQDHGYKTGEYVKVWRGLEDNAHMDELLKTLDVRSESLPGRLYEALERRYRETVAAA
jgi:dimeric dUTPase (all-alpha-NTP-PPase superfamily)